MLDYDYYNILDNYFDYDNIELLASLIEEENEITSDSVLLKCGVRYDYYNIFHDIHERNNLKCDKRLKKNKTYCYI